MQVLIVLLPIVIFVAVQDTLGSICDQVFTSGWGHKCVWNFNTSNGTCVDFFDPSSGMSPRTSGMTVDPINQTFYIVAALNTQPWSRHTSRSLISFNIDLNNPSTFISTDYWNYNETNVNLIKNYAPIENKPVSSGITYSGCNNGTVPQLYSIDGDD